MAKKYLEQLTALIEGTLSSNPEGVKLTYKHFFSGAAVYANGRICVSLTPAGFALKLLETSRAKLLKQKGTKQLRYFPKGHIKADYIVLPPAMVHDSKTLRHWIMSSIEYVLTLPSPIKKI